MTICLPSSIMFRFIIIGTALLLNEVAVGQTSTPNHSRVPFRGEPVDAGHEVAGRGEAAAALALPKVAPRKVVRFADAVVRGGGLRKAPLDTVDKRVKYHDGTPDSASTDAESDSDDEAAQAKVERIPAAAEAIEDLSIGSDTVSEEDGEVAEGTTGVTTVGPTASALSVEELMAKFIPPHLAFFGDEDYIPGFDETAETGRTESEDELPLKGDADMLLELEGRNVWITPSDAAQFVLCVLGSIIALYGWYVLGLFTYDYYYSSSS